MRLFQKETKSHLEPIKYWYDWSEQKLVVLHCPSGKTKKIKNPKRIERFLQAYEATLVECKGVTEDIDRLHLFKKVRVHK
ncbi:hypothetical protein SAMN05444955_1212 [Lihuaxuella thermophila]|uniref:Uncharacterized protein n=2 Tax=Lihuaxuella thermophila TaxID=1173111 RepID=A0A1H8J1V9_9BACL|nr:hypothetical protein SAMN05444955_1212 [Lihuaxuella thermophila]